MIPRLWTCIDLRVHDGVLKRHPDLVHRLRDVLVSGLGLHLLIYTNMETPKREPSDSDLPF